LASHVTRQERRQHLKARPHLAHHVVGGEHRGDQAGLKLHHVAFAQPWRHVDLDGDAEGHQQFGHGAHVRQPRHIAQIQGFGGQQRRSHQFKGGILGAADGISPFSGWPPRIRIRSMETL
jgi:hypothetical protein